METYTIKFRFNDLTFADRIRAESWEDAEARLAAIRETAEIDGKLIERPERWTAREMSLLVCAGWALGFLYALVAHFMGAI